MCYSLGLFIRVGLRSFTGIYKAYSHNLVYLICTVQSRPTILFQMGDTLFLDASQLLASDQAYTVQT